MIIPATDDENNSQDEEEEEEKDLVHTYSIKDKYFYFFYAFLTKPNYIFSFSFR